MESRTILIKNTKIMANEIKKGSILIENDRITGIEENLSSKEADTVIDGDGKILIPGLVNTHTHLSMSLLRGLADDLVLDTWLNDHIWPTEANLDGDICYVGAKLACAEMIKSGTTTFNDMYFYMDHVARAVDESGIRGNISHGMIDQGDEEKRNAEYKESMRIIDKCHNTAEGRIKVSLGPHAPHTCSTELLSWVRKKASQLGIRIHIHVSETEFEVKNIIDTYDARPFEYLDDIGFLDDDVLAAHAVWPSDNEMDIIKESGVNISHNPVSNMKLASGISPVAKMMDKGINLSLGTDGAASNNNLDMLEEMKIAALQQKVNKFDPTVLKAADVFYMATLGGATALGLEKEIGTIEEGKKADLALINMKSPHITPYRHPISHLVYSANGADVDTVICNGQILMQNRNLVMDEKVIIDQAEEAAKELLSKR
ncbi:MAG TPA: amidohydrolase family protein [Methanobacterium sp.]|jgi:5-methylthioadenosine/S-adenosylhomocysteine deaminase|nr:MAG: amidohydrolase family protein [Methanobacterium sp.]HOI72087.1 amidohydrolase family protein [Methanobacterium sp.]